MSAARPQVKTMAPQLKKLYFGFSPGLPRVMLPIGEKAAQSETSKTPSPISR